MDKVVIQIGEALLGRKLFEGYSEYKKDPKFFDENRPGGKYVVRKEDPKRGIRYFVIKKAEADKIRSIPGGKPNKAGYLALWFVPVEYAKDTKTAIWEVERKNFVPIWDWGKGKMKGGFSESIDEASMYPSEGGIIPVVTPPQTGSGGRFGNNGDSEGVGLVAYGVKNTDGSSMYPGVGQVVSIGTPSQSGSVGRFGNEAKKLRDFALGKKASKARDDGYPGTATAKTKVPPWESPSPGQAAGEPCDCDFHGMKDMPSR
jgi:hypothetical protein